MTATNGPSARGEAQWIARSEKREGFISAQNQYNLLERRIEAELVPACRAHEVGILPYFPLASGFLTGKYRRGQEAPEGTRLAAGRAAERALTEARFDQLEALEGFAKERGHSMLELAIGWLASKPQVDSVIAGATSPAQIEQNVHAGEWRLTPEELQQIDELQGRRR